MLRLLRFLWAADRVAGFSSRAALSRSSPASSSFMASGITTNSSVRREPMLNLPEREDCFSGSDDDGGGV